MLDNFNVGNLSPTTLLGQIFKIKIIENLGYIFSAKIWLNKLNDLCYGFTTNLLIPQIYYRLTNLLNILAENNNLQYMRSVDTTKWTG